MNVNGFGMENKEYKIIKDGKLWEDRIDSEQEAIDKVNEYKLILPNSVFVIDEMSDEDISEYYK